MSKLIKDLKSVPDIIGELGLNIAMAQKALNHDYISNLNTIVAIAKDLAGKPAAGGGGGAGGGGAGGAGNGGAVPAPELGLVLDVIKQLAPVRYMYSETTLSVKLDLAQTTEVGGSAALGGGIGALMVNAAFSLAFKQEYRGTAECSTVIHVDNRSGAVSDAMMARVKELQTASASAQLADAPPIDQKIYDSLTGLRNSLKN